MLEKVIRVFHGFAEAEVAELAEDQSMTPEQRIELMLELRERFEPNSSQQALERVFRVTRLERS
ncbi:MAG: hypothetical protein U0Q16_25125 [Bryobacteraceae bacterium]